MQDSLGSSTVHKGNIPKHHTKSEQKFEGFDFLRAIFSVIIVAYKTKIFYVPEILIPSSLTYGLSGYVLSGMVGALAVPVFLQMSLFLFYLKSEKAGFVYFVQKRLPRLISLYIFWVGLITAFELLSGGGFESVKKATSSLKSFFEFIVSGNNIPYFFFFSLIFVTILAEVLVLLLKNLVKPGTEKKVSYFLLIIFLVFSLVLVFVFSSVNTIINYTGIQTPLLNFLNSLAHWDYNPLNFLPYIFTAAITAQEYNQGKLGQITRELKIKLYSLLFLTLAFFTLEWALTSRKLLIQVDQAPLDHYMRLSLVFGSWLLLYLALLSKLRTPEMVKFISGCSLGIYGFHVFFGFKRPLSFDKIPFLGELFQSFPTLNILAIFVITLFGSIALALLFKEVKSLKKFVSV